MIVECPQCKGYRLEPFELEPGLVAASCSKCDGVLLSLMNYRYWADTAAGTGEDPGVEAGLAVEDNTAPKQCPKCRRIMTKFKIGGAVDNKVELCVSCDEAWLDAGEWRLLAALDLQDKLPKIFTEAWQRNIRQQRRAQHIDKQFEALLGAADFGRLREFKAWLESHPEKWQIRQYLTIEAD